MKHLTAIIIMALFSFFPTSATAAPFTLNFSGSTISTITDGTNYFGLGNTVALGTDYAINVTLEEIPGVNGIIEPIRPLIGFAGHTYCCSSTPPSSFLSPAFLAPNHISVIEIIMNGVSLAIATPQFTSFDTTTERIVGTCCGSFGLSENTNRFRTTGSSAEGSTIAFGLSARSTSQPQPGGPILTSNFLTASLSLLLLANDGSTLANIAAVSAFGLRGENKGGENPDVPLPAGLPLLAAGMAGLAALARRQRSAGGR